MPPTPQRLSRENFPRLIERLRKDGYSVMGPTLRDNAIVYDEIHKTEDLPIGWTDEQDGGRYRLKRREDAALFGYAVGPQSFKKYLFPPSRRLWQAQRAGTEVKFTPEPAPVEKLAFFGIRSCELEALLIQDKVFLAPNARDPYYSAVRESLFLVAVNCHTAGGTCFCVSMGTGPEARRAYDLSMTEILTAERHEFILHAGSPKGIEAMRGLPLEDATPGDLEQEKSILDRTRASMGRRLDTKELPKLLATEIENPRWQEVATRCLTCANCTMACPTCFCSNVEEVSDLEGEHTERWRRWDSCFNVDFSYLHGGSVRQSPSSRYRQWMTHKLSSWHEQFETSGCVGCGRCITWCPVGIDITEEAAAIRRDVEQRDA